ncbi:hypothetical protein BH10BAC5_BH10BAC5_21650 [soil metagenome]
MKDSLLLKSISVLLLILLASTVLYFGAEFLIPVTIASLLSMLFLPLCKKLERSGLAEGFAALTCVFIFLLIIGSLTALIYWQVTNIADDFENIKHRFADVINGALNYLHVSSDDQKKVMEKLKSGLGTAVGSFISFLTDFILVLVYIWMFLYFRQHVNKFIMMLIPASKKATAQKVIADAGKVAENYLLGYGKTIIALWILYGIGFSVLGIKNAILLAVICGLLELIPFVGNVFGVGLAMLMAVSQGGGTGMAVWAAGIYIVVQFLQTYILEPVYVGGV